MNTAPKEFRKECLYLFQIAVYMLVLNCQSSREHRAETDIGQTMEAEREKLGRDNPPFRFSFPWRLSENQTKKRERHQTSILT